jgi:hypothetical protein
LPFLINASISASDIFKTSGDFKERALNTLAAGVSASPVAPWHWAQLVLYKLAARCSALAHEAVMVNNSIAEIRHTIFIA